MQTLKTKMFLPALALLLAGGFQSAQAATPALVRATSWYPFTTVRVEFSEPIASESGTNPAHYALKTSGGADVPITGAAFGTTAASAGVVVLSADLAAGSSYTLLVNNISDESGANTLASAELSFTSLDIRVAAINNTQTASAEPVGNKIYTEGGGGEIFGTVGLIWLYLHVGEWRFRFQDEAGVHGHRSCGSKARNRAWV